MRPTEPRQLRPDRPAPRRPRGVLSAVLVIFAAFVAAAPLRAQDVDPRRAELVDRLAVLLRERDALQNEARRRDEVRRGQQEMIDQLVVARRHDTELARAALEELRARVARRRQEVQDRRAAAALPEAGIAVRAAAARLLAIVAPGAAGAVAGADEDDHVPALRELATRSVPAAPDEVSRLLAILEEEARGLAEVTLANREIDLPDGRRLHAFILRLGALARLFATEDGEAAGHLVRGATGWTARPLDASARRSIEDAVRAVRGRAHARVLALPAPREGAR